MGEWWINLGEGMILKDNYPAGCTLACNSSYK